MNDHKHLLIVLAGCSVVAVNASSLLALTAPPAWPNPPVLIDPAASYVLQPGDRFLAFDHHGVPAISYVDFFGDVFFAQQTAGGGWGSGLVMPGLGASGASLAFNRSELPAISYGEALFGMLHFQQWNPVTMLWDDQILGPPGFWIETSVAFDVLGNPAVAGYEDAFTGDLVFIRDNDGDGDLILEPVEIVTPGIGDRRPSLAFDPINRPLIGTNTAFVPGGAPGMEANVYARNPILGWPLFSLLAAPAVEGIMPSNVSVAIDPDDGQPAVAWTNPIAGELWYAKWDELTNSWDDGGGPVVVEPFEIGNESLAFDPADGNPAISYSNDMGDVLFAFHDGVAWASGPVVATGFPTPTRTSLAFNGFGNGFPAIAYVAEDFAGGGVLSFIIDPPVAIPEPGSALILAGIATVLMLVCGRNSVRNSRPNRGL